MERQMIDIHCHLIPGVDDGAANMEMAMNMLLLSASQGITGIFATPHSSAFDLYGEEAGEQLRRLRAQARKLFPDMALYSGCEVYCEGGIMNQILTALEAGIYPSMNDTKYVLLEFSPWVRAEEAKRCARALLDHGWSPVIAHMERYGYLRELPELAEQFRDMGCLIQINAYSLSDEKDEAIRQWARRLAERRLADFLGTDAHRTYHRPPCVSRGLDWLYEHCDQDYADGIAFRNAQRLLIQ